MIKTLKAELKLRPTYDELVGMIESQGDENRPPIEKIIDRRATLFRNNQFGSQFDNIDFLGLKKQEEDRAKENLRDAQLKKAGIEAGTSTGLIGINLSGFVEPSLASGLSTPAIVNEDAMLRPEPTDEEIDEIRRNLRASNDLRKAEEQKALEIIRASMIGDTERYREQVRKQQFEISQMAKNDLSDVYGQVLPAGVPVHSMDAPVQSNQGYPPSLPPPPQQPITEEADDTEQIMKIIDDMNIQQSVKAGIKFDLGKMNLNDWSKISPNLMKRDTILTMFKIADKMGRLNEEQKEQLNIIEEKLKSSSQDTPERTQAMEEARELFRNAFHNESVGEEEDASADASSAERDEEELTALEQKVAYTSGFDPDKVMEDDSVNYKGLMFQLHVRDLLTPETIELLNKIPTDQKKKKYLVSLMEGLKENDEWNADFNSEKLSRKIKEFKKIRKQVKSKVVEPSAGSSSSSSGGGIGSAIASGAKAVGGAVLEAGKEAVKEAVVAGARNAVMSLI